MGDINDLTRNVDKRLSTMARHRWFGGEKSPFHRGDVSNRTVGAVSECTYNATYDTVSKALWAVMEGTHGVAHIQPLMRWPDWAQNHDWSQL